MGVGVPRRDVGIIQLQASVHQLVRYAVRFAEVPEQVRYRVDQGLGADLLEGRYRRLLRRLLGREAGPVVEPLLQITAGVLQVPPGPRTSNRRCAPYRFCTLTSWFEYRAPLRYRPINFGDRFSTKALIPSWKSAVRAASLMARASSSRCVARSVFQDRSISSFVRA